MSAECRMQNAECRMSGPAGARRIVHAVSDHSALCTLHSALCTRRRSASALTLIEILIAMFIFLVGGLGILSLFPVAMNNAGRVLGETRGNIIAQSVVAQITGDCKCPYFSGTVATVTAGTLTFSGTLPPMVKPGYFVTITSGSDEGQSRIIWQINGNVLSVCPDWSPLPQPAPTPPATAPIADSFIITPLAMPWYPVYQVDQSGTVSGLFSVSGNAITANPSTGNVWRASQWDGYSVIFTSGNCKGISRSILGTTATTLTLGGTALDTSSAGIQSGDFFAIVDMNARSGYVRAVATSSGGTTNDSIDAGALDPTDPSGQYVTALSWNPNTLWYKPSAFSGSATGGSSSMLVSSNAGWTATAPGTTSDFRGCLAVIVNDGNNSAFKIANQVRLITSNLTDTLNVFPNWTLPSDWNNTTDWAHVQFIIREQPDNYFLLITSGQSTGRIFRITGFTSTDPTSQPDKYGNRPSLITCAGVDFGSFGVKQAYNPGAASPNDYVARNASTFQIVGVNGYPSSAYPAYSAPIDAAHLPYPYPYQLNAFGYPGTADLQTRNDTFIQTTSGQETQTSDYSYTCIFSGNGAQPTGSVRADVLIFRNYDSAKPVPNNHKPVGYMSGYIKRP